MCGIAGILNLGDAAPPQRETLAAMARPLVPRGPDGAGHFITRDIGLVHRRLSIIDLEGGAQPLTNEDGTIWTIFNGEIFNFVELRRELSALGHVFRTRSDTEVIVHGYEAWGDDMLHHLNGQFAIALWDAPRRRLLLARDRPGILPLFVSTDAGRLLFASSIRSLLAARAHPPALDLAGLDAAFTFWAPTAPQTLFEGIECLRPGEKLVAAGGRITRERFWDWPFDPEAAARPVDERAAAETLRDLLIDATRLRLRADVPVGAYLSGGLDSSVLTTIIARHTDTPLETFSIGFEDAALDESGAQALMAAHLGTTHHAVTCRREDVAAGFADAVVAAESVLLRAAPVPMMRLSALARGAGFRVVLTGEGADEVLGGYDLFKEAKIRQFWARQPQSKARPRLLSRLYPYLDVNPTRAQAYLEAFFRQGLDAPEAPLFSHQPRMQTTTRLKAFLNPERTWPSPEAAAAAVTAELPAGFAGLAPFHRAQLVECRTLLPSYLLSSQGDRMLMANSVEGRFPFLDHRIAEFALALPPHLLMRGLTEKALLKRAMGAALPREIVRRPKQPYRAPGSSAFLSPAHRDATRAHLTPEALQSAGLFQPEPVQRLLTKLEAGGPVGEKDNMALLGILSAQVLHARIVRGDSPGGIGFKPDADSTDSLIGRDAGGGDTPQPRRT